MTAPSITILTHSYLDGYNFDVKRTFGGGLERYIHLLCQLIRQMGVTPIVHQFSYYGAFEVDYEGCLVRGFPFDPEQIAIGMERMADSADSDSLLIYASCIWHPIKYRSGSLAICHGVSWDRHDLPLQTKVDVARNIGEAMQQLELVVSVDSHFQTYCRSVAVYEDADQVALLPNPVDVDWFTPVRRPNSAAPEGDARLRLLFPRRLSYERGLVLMMLISNELLALHPQLTVEFAGELVEGTPLASAFHLWTAAHPHRTRIIHQTYTFAEVREAYRAADVVVIPTLFSEGTSLSCLEAMSCGVPVVATNIGGLNDIVIDGLNGRLVAPTAQAMLPAIDELLQDASARRMMGRMARRTAHSFRLQKWQARWRDILEAQLALRPLGE
ncbi:glycosyltransferase family 4 protein [Paenibacillus sp. GCM10023252]|uniref:glycosyltransferase family 4 protein n=1 Tax=Paenibacillus sp. GCM10023252 TaxID=3252649 RepID=UPI00360F53CD